MLDVIPKRYIFSFIGLLCTSLSMILQTNLSLAIVYMVNIRNKSVLSNESSVECVADEINNYDDEKWIEHSEKFDWGPELEGIALGAEYYGMTIAFIFGGRFAEIYGGKITLISSMLLASLFTAFLPVAAHISVYLFIVCRLVVGLGTAPLFPVLFYMLPRWIPETGRSFNASLLFAGFGIGAFVSFLVSGALCSSDLFGGWPSVFYFGGLVGLVICILSFLLVYETPNRHPTITSIELDYLTKNLSRYQDDKQNNTFPWIAMITSVPFWALAFGYFGQFWILGFYATSQPLYMGTILKLNSVENGSLSCVPNLARALFSCFCGIILDYVVSKRHVPVVYIRKAATIINSTCACLGFVGVIYAGCDAALNTAYFIAGSLTGGFLTFGVCLAAVDIAPQYAGTTSGILSSISTIPYFVLPSMIGYLTKDGYSMERWRHVYYWTIGVIVITTVVYVVFGTSEPQPWAMNRRNKANVQTSSVESTNGQKKKNEEEEIQFLDI